MRDWAGQLGSCVYFFSCPTDPSLSAGPGVVPFARLFALLPSRRPPHSVRGHGLGNRAAKQRHGTGFAGSFFFVSSCRHPPQLRAGGAARVIWLLTVAQDCKFCLLFFVMHVICFLSAMRFWLGTPPPRGTVGCATFPFRVGFRLLSRPPRRDD